MIAWNRGVLGKYAGNPIQDPRTTICERDVAKILRKERQSFDAILLDVDNGPEGMTRKKNDWLYTEDGLTEAYTALRPGDTRHLVRRPEPQFQGAAAQGRLHRAAEPGVGAG